MTSYEREPAIIGAHLERRHWAIRSIHWLSRNFKVGLELAAVIAALAAATAAIYQAKVTQEALELTRQQVQQGETAGKKQADDTAEQLRLTRDSLRIAQKNADAAALSARASREALDFSRVSFKMVHRANVVQGISFGLQPRPKRGDVQVTVHHKNLGQTLALHFKTEVTIATVPVGASGNLYKYVRAFHARGSDEFIAPGTEGFNRFELDLPIDVVDQILADRVDLIVATWATYEDIFGDQHEYSSCGAWLRHSNFAGAAKVCPPVARERGIFEPPAPR